MQVFVDITRYVKSKFWDLLMLMLLSLLFHPLLREWLTIRSIYLAHDQEKLLKLRKTLRETLFVQKQQGLLKKRQRHSSLLKRVSLLQRVWLVRRMKLIDPLWNALLDWERKTRLKQPNQHLMQKMMYLHELYDSYLIHKTARFVMHDKRWEYRDALEQWEIQEYHIKGWVTKVLPEEWCRDLEDLRYRWVKQDKGKFWIEIMTSFHLLAMFKAYLQIKVENL